MNSSNAGPQTPPSDFWLMFAFGFAFFFFCISFIAERSCLKLIIPQNIVLHKSLFLVTTEDCFDGNTFPSTVSDYFTTDNKGAGLTFQFRCLVQGSVCHTACAQGILGT